MSAMLCVLLCGVVLSAEPKQQQSCLPANIEISRGLTRVLQDLQDRSMTFRAQCEQIAGARNLRVIVIFNVSMPSSCRAFTRVHRADGEIRAEVHLPSGRPLTELIAHEFEHLLEQLEGLDLRELARTRGTGVRQTEREFFESDRAIKAGRLVEAEVLAWRGAPAAD